MDASIVTIHMMFEAPNIGIDNIWIAMFNENILRKELEIPSNFTPIALLPIGYKSKTCPPSPFHIIRKYIKDLVEYK